MRRASGRSAHRRPPSRAEESQSRAGDARFDGLLDAVQGLDLGHVVELDAMRGASLELRTLSDQGLSGFEGSVWHAIYAPKNTPAGVTARLSDVLQRAITDRDFLSAIVKLGAIRCRLAGQHLPGLNSTFSRE